MPNKKRRKTVIVIALLGVGLAAGLVIAYWDNVTDWVAAAVPESSPDDVDQDLVNSNNQFAFDLYAQLSKADVNDNIFFSPLSLSTILAQTYAGARGNTAKEIREALHFDLEPARLHAAMAAPLSSLEPPQGRAPYELNIANALWVEQSYSLLPEFTAIGKDHYRAAPHSVDFKTAAEAQAKTINDWVEEHTRGRIKDLIPAGSLSADTRLVLTNAIYFKGAWKARFAPAVTRLAPFTTGGGKIVKVPLMSQEHEFRYMEETGFQVLEMPYIGDTLSMLVLLPRKVDGLSGFEKTMTATALGDWTKKLRKGEVRVHLPRFTMAMPYTLNSSLQALGMRDAFSSQTADFSGASDEQPLFVHTIEQKTFVEVNEEGTQAAAAVRNTMLAVAAPVEFTADHPFIFLIRDIHSGSILFLGRVMNPTTT